MPAGIPVWTAGFHVTDAPLPWRDTVSLVSRDGLDASRLPRSCCLQLLAPSIG